MADKIDLIIQQYPDVWKTRSAFFSWIKGAIRKAWSKHPVRTGLLKKRIVQLENTNPRSMKRFPTVAAVQCENCGEVVKKDMAEVDHNHNKIASLTKIEDIQSCVEALLLVTEEDLQVLCKPCHEVITFARDHNLSFEEAVLEKKVVQFKSKKAKEQRKVLTECNISETMMINEEGRVNQYRQWLKQQEEQ